jgi:hypothetical protein
MVRAVSTEVRSEAALVGFRSRLAVGHQELDQGVCGGATVNSTVL